MKSYAGFYLIRIALTESYYSYILHMHFNLNYTVRDEKEQFYKVGLRDQILENG